LQLGHAGKAQQADTVESEVKLESMNFFASNSSAPSHLFKAMCYPVYFKKLNELKPINPFFFSIFFPYKVGGVCKHAQYYMYT